MVEKERLRRIFGLEEGDGSEAEERDRESESGVSIRDDALRRFTAPTRFRNATVSVCSPASASLIGVPPHRSFLLTSAPWQTKNSTASRCPSAAARCKAVRLS